jgi:uncharacterized protein YjbI with pentapeptide repeats
VNTAASSHSQILRRTLKIDRTATDLVASESIELANRFLSFESTNFSDQIAFLGIDPTRELRHADLSFADFSRSDLSGYDFTGANLHGVTGIEVKWDSTTNFHDADVSNSVFSYPLAKQKFFSENPDHAERVERLKNALGKRYPHGRGNAKGGCQDAIRQCPEDCESRL